MPIRRLNAVRRHPRAFTIVEILVVVGIIAIMMSLIVSGLRGALGAARKTKELNGLRGVHAAWTAYANTYEENLLPGYLDEQSQANWSVEYQNLSGQAMPRALTQTYPWRLARYMDSPYNALLSYLELEASTASANDEPSIQWDGAPTPPAWMAGAFGQPGSLLSLQPAFSYNAVYVGGWYTSQAAGATNLRFDNASWTSASANNAPRTGGLVATRLASISRTSEVVVFAGGTLRPVGGYKYPAAGEDRIPGNSWIVPPMLGTQGVWGPSIGGGTLEGMNGGGSTGGMGDFWLPGLGISDTGLLGVNTLEGVPVRRHNGLVATVKADGSTESTNIGALMDMRVWIDAADRADFTHGD
jgi:type II secretory pathway pseudopilin PulG